MNLSDTTIGAPDCVRIPFSEERADESEVLRCRNMLHTSPLVTSLLQTIPTPFVVLNQFQQIVTCNQAFLELIGSDDEEDLLGHRSGEALGCIHAMNGENGCGTTPFCGYCGSPEAILQAEMSKLISRECRINSKANDAFVARDLKATTKSFEIDGIKFTLMIMENIEDEKRRKALERIFFHDVLNSASNVSNIIELLDQCSASDGEFDEIKELLRVASNRMISEIEYQRMLSNAENNDLVLHPSSLSSLGLLKSVVGSFRGHEKHSEVSVVIDKDTEDIAFKSDDTVLSRIISNLLVNAIEACEKGSTITLGCKMHAGELMFYVNNPGVIPLNTQMQLFKRSFSTKGGNRGLGTYSVRLLTERYLHGHVTFASSEEDGTSFYVFLPLDSAK